MCHRWLNSVANEHVTLSEISKIFATVDAARMDGVELLDQTLLVATQSDSSLYVIAPDPTGTPAGRRHLRLPGRPADIGLDRRRRRVAIPYIALDRVDIWQLPAGMPSAMRPPTSS